MEIKKICILLLLMWSATLFAQTTCKKEHLIGTWMRAGIYISPKDTITKEKLNRLVNDSVKETGWGYVFEQNRAYEIPKNKKTKVRSYVVDEYCTIIFSGHIFNRRYGMRRIVYMDEKYLVFQIPNAHWYSIACFRKK